MTSVTKILIFIIAITGEGIALHNDTDQPDACIEESSQLKPIDTNNNDIVEWMKWLLETKLDQMQTSSMAESTTIESIDIQHPSQMNRQALVQMRGDSDSAMSFASSRSPLDVNVDEVNPTSTKMMLTNRRRRQSRFEMKKRIQQSTLKNRNRRSASNVKLSSDKNITAIVIEAPRHANHSEEMNAYKCLFFHFLCPYQ